MAELSFSVLRAGAVSYCVTPTLSVRLQIESAEPERPIEAIALDCQVRIEAQRRQYGDEEKSSLHDLFGPPDDWARTLRSLLWTHVSVSVPPFAGSVEVDLHIPCTYDFNVVAARYLHGLQSGQVPILLLFSGSVFEPGPEGRLEITRIAWTSEVAFRLPVEVWKEVIEIYYPNTAWLCLRRDAFDRLAAFKASASLPTWESALEALLEGAVEPKLA